MEVKEALFEYCLRLGDTSLILGHRISEWCGHGPILEEDIALTNIALDLIGQARTTLSYAGAVEGKGRSEDDLAYLRDAFKYRNLLLVEQENGDFGTTLARQFLFDVYHFYLLEELKSSSDQTLADYAEKSLKEVTYHLRHSSEWIIRLGDGTDESKERIQISLNALWMFTGELFEMDKVDSTLVLEGIAPDLTLIKTKWEIKVSEILNKATLDQPESGWMQSGGKQGRHGELLGFILADLQYMQRAYPGCQW
jgi:ring-1,2-phenylacetyl-CoA epoxidase subunit PaaC